MTETDVAVRASLGALRALAGIRAEGRRTATHTEREALAGWSGWGPLAPMFGRTVDEAWQAVAEQVRELLPGEDVRRGGQGTYNGFRVPAPVAAAVWRVLRQMGFTGGTVANLGCGDGVFLATRPDSVRVTAVDRDPTSTDICRLIYPGVSVTCGELETVRLVGGFVAAIGAVPVGEMDVFDPAAPGPVTATMTNYYVWRAVSVLAPGGIAVLVVPRDLLDGRSRAVRDVLAGLAAFVGAVRLPDGATEVPADVIVVRRHAGRSIDGQSWPGVDFARFGRAVAISRWWETRPGMVLPDDAPVTDGIRQAGRELAAVAAERGLMCRAERDGVDLAAVTSAEGWLEGSMRLVDGGVVTVVDGRACPLPEPGAELVALLALRDLVLRLKEEEADYWVDDEEIAPLRAECAAAYAAYVNRWGSLNRSRLIEGAPDEVTGFPTYTRKFPPMGGIRKDPDVGDLFAIEVYDEETGEAKPAPILFARQNVPPARPARTDDPAQALGWCLDRRAGRVDVGYIADLLGVDPDSVPGMLGDAVYLDPVTRGWVTAEEYLSGEVRDALDAAVTAAKVDGRFVRNVDALRAVQPKWLGPGEITVNLGAPWVDVRIVEKFVAELLRYPARVRRVADRWEVTVNSLYSGSVAATAEWGTDQVNGYRLVELALNHQMPTAYQHVSVGGRSTRRKDQAGTLAAVEKMQQIRARWSEWVWECPERADLLEKVYNRRFNGLRPRRFSGEHITVDGLASWFEPYAHQREYVARALVTRAGLCGFPVGAGKTATTAMTAMKLRQSRCIRRPLVVVPNHLLEQIDRDFRQLFPAAQILSASAKTVSANRLAFAARCQSVDWDIVVLTHNAFNALPVGADTERAYLLGWREDLRTQIIDDCPDGYPSGKVAVDAAKRVRELGWQADKVTRAEREVTFEDLGIDCVFVDESQEYKSLHLACRTDGFTVRPAQRATGLDMKLSWLARQGSGHYVSLFSGTPISNTMLELCVLLHYLMPDYLRAIGLGSADAWAAAYVQFTTAVDVTVDGGGFQLRTRPQFFVNAPELRVLITQVADIRTAKQLGLVLPEADVRTIVVKPTAVQRAAAAGLVERVEVLKKLGRAARDCMLDICNQGRWMATDPALVGLNDPEPGKLARVAKEILSVWRENPDALQLAFCDVGTPGAKGPQTYGRLRRMLTDGGMPVGRIRFVHDAKSDADKAALFRACRSGEVSVLVGSSIKLGTGVNIQDLVSSIHHLDVPYRPSDVEQRDGRGVRRGNRHKVVRLYRYVTEGTFDAYSWQLLVRKIRFITQVLSGNVDRIIEDVTPDEVLGYEETQAAATGQPLLLERSTVALDVHRLQGLRRTHRATADRLRRDIPSMRDEVANVANEDAQRLRAELADAERMVSQPFPHEEALAAAAARLVEIDEALRCKATSDGQPEGIDDANLVSMLADLFGGVGAAKR